MPGLARVHGRKLLRAWIDRSNFENQEKAAKALGYTAGFLSQLLTGERKPSLEVALDLWEKTGVPVTSWVLSRVSKTEKQGQKQADKSKYLQTVKADAD